MRLALQKTKRENHGEGITGLGGSKGTNVNTPSTRGPACATGYLSRAGVGSRAL